MRLATTLCRPRSAAIAALVATVLAVATDPAWLVDARPVGPGGLALVVGGSTDGSNPIERLAARVRAVSDRIDDRDDHADEPPALDLDRDDELGELAAAIDDLATAAVERTRRYEERERADRALEAAPIGVTVGDREASGEPIVYANEAFERTTGYDESGWRGEHPRFLAGSETDPDRVAALEEAIAAGESTTVELRNYRADGTEFWNRVRVAPVEDADESAEYVCVHEDVTDRTEHERRLSATTARLEALFDGSPDMIDVLDPDGRIVEANRRFCDELGYDAEELVGTGIWTYDELADAADVRALLDGMAVGERRRFEGRYRRRDGSTFPTEVHLIRLDLETADRFVAISRDVTERKRRERDLERYREYTDDVLDAIDDVFYVLDADGTFQRWNESLSAATGYDHEEIEGRHALSFFDPDDRPKVAEAIETVFETGEVRIEVPFRTATGERVPYEFVASRLESPEGEPVLTGIGRDISARKRYERDLERTTNLLDQAQRIARVGGWELDATADPPSMTGTEEFYRLHGLSPGADLELDLIVEQYHPADREYMREQFREAIESGEGYDMEVRLVTDGAVRWVRALCEPIVEGGEVRRLRGSVQDITDRKRRERELERSETVIQALDELVYVIDEDGVFQFVNDALTPLTGLEPEELVGEHVSSVMTEADLETARGLILEMLRSGEPSRTFEMDLLTRDGEVIDAENHMALLPMPDGEFAGTAGVVRDVTDRKERERELERIRRLLERVQELANVGGWELDVRTEPSMSTWTEELYRLHGLSPETSPDLETIVECYHPEDRSRVRRAVEESLSTGTGYELEARMQPRPDETRWVRAVSEPVFEDESGQRVVGTPPDGADPVAFLGAIQDVTEQKEREFALESLHEAARGLLGAETVAEVADLVVEAAEEVLEATGIALYRLDASVNRLRPVARSDGFDALSTETPSVAVGNGDAVVWNAFVSGERAVVDDSGTIEQSPIFDAAVESAVVVPIGDHGVFTVATGNGPIDAEARRLIETLVATAAAAFDRLESEASLRERDAELEARNRRLRRQIAVTETIRRINVSLVGATGREEIERTVPERLVEAEDVAFAWIGRPDPDGTTLEPVAWAGTGEEYLDRISLDAATAAEPAARTVREGGPTVVENAVDALQREGWRRHALDAGFESVVSVPLAFEEYTYGVLTAYATEPGVFTALERTVFAELGETIANAIAATKTREALHAETVVELTLALSDSTDVLSRIAARTDARVEFEGLGTHSGTEAQLFFETHGSDPDAVRETLDALVSVHSYRLLSCDDDVCRFEALVAGDVLAAQVVRHGASPRSIRATGEETVVTVDAPAGTDVREFVSILAETHGEVDLRRRRHVERPVHTRRELVTSLLGALTDRQLEVLRTAYFAGYFEWPRESTGEDVAEMLEVSQPTVNRHLRLAQQRLLSQLFGTDAAVSADG